MRQTFAWALLLAPVFTMAGNWITASNGCKLWNDEPQANESVQWSGACVAGKASGPGRAEWLLNGKVAEWYEGDYRAGKMDGKGTLQYKDGNRYQGDMRKNRMYGEGSFTFADGVRYTGTIANDAWTGFGTLSLPRGHDNIALFEGKGRWVNDRYEVSGCWEDDDLIVATRDGANCGKGKQRR
ncbi:hypothetical protein [Chitinimonas sp.]|uniref:hypothetical protein n=1 Tax=Chitinimonas sp. TaxID=1934313 RepID=UPI0035B2853F